MTYKEACIIARYCDNLPPSMEKFIKDEQQGE